MIFFCVKRSNINKSPCQWALSLCRWHRFDKLLNLFRIHWQVHATWSWPPASAYGNATLVWSEQKAIDTGTNYAFSRKCQTLYLLPMGFLWTWQRGQRVGEYDHDTTLGWLFAVSAHKWTWHEDVQGPWCEEIWSLTFLWDLGCSSFPESQAFQNSCCLRMTKQQTIIMFNLNFFP